MATPKDILIRSVDLLLDAEQICNIHNHYVMNSLVTYETEEVSLEDMKKRIEGIKSKYPYLVAVAKDDKSDDETFLGYSYASQFKSRAAYDWTVETAIILDPCQTGKGYARPLYHEMINQLRIKGFVKAVAKISMPFNQQSFDFRQKMGFKIFAKLSNCGYKFNSFQDAWLMELQLNDPTIPPPKLWPTIA